MKESFVGTEGVLVASPRRRVALGLAGVLATGSLALSLAWGGTPALAHTFVDETSGDQAGVAASSGSESALAETVAAQVLPSVGSVYAEYTQGSTYGISQGSCEVLTSDGYILTNYHIVEESSRIQVALNDEIYEAELVGADPTSDVAVIKIDAGDTALTPIQIGDSSALSVGEWVMTVGTPYGESGSVSTGIVSALSRTATESLDTTDAYYVGLIQSDAMMNSGSSGGAMVNAAGELVGITTLSATSSGDWAGMSYAIPSNYAIDIAHQIIDNGSVEHPQLGVSVANILDMYRYGSYDIKNAASLTGAYIAEVVEGSGAATAGIQEGDVVTELNGKAITSAESLIIGVRSNNIGDTVTLTVERDGAEQQIDVVLGSDADAATTTGDAVELEDDATASEPVEESTTQKSPIEELIESFGFGAGSDSGAQEFPFGGQRDSGNPWGSWSIRYGNGQAAEQAGQSA